MNISDFTSIIRVVLLLCAAGAVVSGIAKAKKTRKNERGSGIGSIAVGLILAAFCIWAAIFLGDASGGSDEYIKAQHPLDVPDITYGQVLDTICGNQEWYRMTSEGSDSGQAVVQMDADCNYGGTVRRITIQFNYGKRDFAQIDADTPFQITFVGFDDMTENSIMEMQNLIYEMFAHYASNHAITLDTGARDTILYSEGWNADNITTKTTEKPTETVPQQNTAKNPSDDTFAKETPKENPPADEQGQDDTNSAGSYYDYMEWSGYYDDGWMETELSFSLYTDGPEDSSCGFITTWFRGNETSGDLYHLGDNKFMWDMGGEIYYVYAVKNNGKYQLDLYDSDEQYDVTFTLYDSNALSDSDQTVLPDGDGMGADLSDFSYNELGLYGGTYASDNGSMLHVGIYSSFDEGTIVGGLSIDDTYASIRDDNESEGLYTLCFENGSESSVMFYEDYDGYYAYIAGIGSYVMTEQYIP